MRFQFKKIATIIVLCFITISVYGQGDAIRPQLWSNLYLGWNANERFSLRNGVAYNILFSSEQPWSEITISSTAVFKFHHFLEASAGIYYARSKQTADIKSHEARPYIGFRISTKSERRWMISNLSRIELRRFISSKNQNSTSFRFRNRTYAAVALNKRRMSDVNNLVLFGYFEAFFNFGQEVRERFFNQFKYKLGFSYRISSRWNADAGIIYQDALNNIKEPTQLPTNIITNYVFEWGVAYIIGPRGEH